MRSKPAVPYNKRTGVPLSQTVTPAVTSNHLRATRSAFARGRVTYGEVSIPPLTG
jgi:hypothetical protein